MFLHVFPIDFNNCFPIFYFNPNSNFLEKIIAAALSQNALQNFYKNIFKFYHEIFVDRIWGVWVAYEPQMLRDLWMPCVFYCEIKRNIGKELYARKFNLFVFSKF